MTPPDTLPTIACIGAANEDRRARLHGPYQPATSNPVAVETTAGGVARNVAEGLARLGADVEFFGMVGHDTAGESLLAGLAAAGVGIANLTHDSNRPTGSYTAVVDQDGALVCGLADMSIYDALTPAWLESVASGLHRCAVWCVDANLPAPTLAALATTAPENTLIFADPVSAAKAPRLVPLLSSLDAIFPDIAEAAALTGQPVEGPDDALGAARALVGAGVRRAFVSLGAHGVAAATTDNAAIYPAFTTDDDVDVTGAGDAFLSGVVYGTIFAEANPPPVAYGLAAANLALHVATAVPADLTGPRLRQHTRAHWRGPLPS